MVRREINLSSGNNHVFVGLRRAGKSFLMYQIIKDMIAQGRAKEEILYFNFEDDRASNLELEDLDLIKVSYEEMYAHKPIFFLDEIQIVDGWEKFARRLADTGHQVYITGSNAKMLSREIATTLGGRYIIQEVFPYSFKEYLKASGTEVPAAWEYRNPPAIVREFETYFRFGGIPETLRNDEPFKRGWLSNLFNKIYFGDLLSRHSIRNELTIKMLVRKLAESVKQPVSYNRLAGLVSTVCGKVKQETIVDYISYLVDSWLIFPLENYAAKLADKVSNRKYYFTDNGILNLFLIDPNTSLLENQIAIMLRRLYPEELFFYNDGVEVDFVLSEQKVAIQVAYTLTDGETKNREIKSLLALHKRYPMQRLLIITKDQEELLEVGGIKIEVRPAWKWLLEHS